MGPKRSIASDVVARGVNDRPSNPVQRGELLGGIAIGVLFLVPLLIYGPFDEEEVTLGIFASQVHYQALVRGEWAFWLNNFGFGTPLPIGTRLDFHPLFALAAVAPLRITLSVIWLAHVLLMVVFFLRLAAATGIRTPLRMILLVCYLFSVVSICWFYENDWLTYVIGWSVLPVLVYYLRRAVLGEAQSHFWLTTVRLALLFGFWVLNSHPGYVLPVAAALVVYTVAAAPPDRRVYLCLVGAFVVCAAICAERVYFFASEMQLFSDSLSRVLPRYTASDYKDAAIAPFAAVDPTMRLPFIGLVLGAAALWSLRYFAAGDAHVRACAVTFIAALVLSVEPASAVASAWTASSGAWIFRDPMVFFGLLAGGCVLQRGLASPQLWLRSCTWILVALQVVQQGATIAPGFRVYFSRRGDLQFFRHQGHSVGLAGLLADEARRFGPRIYLSRRVQESMRGALSSAGIHEVTDLVFLGLNPINGYFKSISMDRLHPSWQLMHGFIGGERDVIENGALLDVLGINMILTTEIEGPVPPDLSVRQRLNVENSRGARDLMLLANPDAWPIAVLMETRARTVPLPPRPDCSHEAALCRDYRAFAEQRLPDRVSIESENGEYRVRVPPADRERLLFMSALYRPEWQAASSSGALRIDPIGRAFLSVTVPAGVEEIHLTFVPRTRVALTWLGGLALFVSLGAFAALWWRGRRIIESTVAGASRAL